MWCEKVKTISFCLFSLFFFGTVCLQTNKTFIFFFLVHLLCISLPCLFYSHKNLYFYMDFCTETIHRRRNDTYLLPEYKPWGAITVILNIQYNKKFTFIIPTGKKENTSGSLWHLLIQITNFCTYLNNKKYGFL